MLKILGENIMGKVTNYFKNKEYIEEYRPYGLATTSHKDGTPEVYTEEDKKQALKQLKFTKIVAYCK